MASVNKPRAAWEDRFRTPTAEELLGALGKQLSSLTIAVRDRMTSLTGCHEELTWHGIPWRWTFVYRSEARPDRAVSYLVPQPSKPFLVLPISQDAIGKIPLRKLSRPVRDSLGAASLINGFYWAQWDLQSRAQLDELLLIATSCLADDTVAV